MLVYVSIIDTMPTFTILSLTADVITAFMQRLIKPTNYLYYYVLSGILIFRTVK